jgi:hypothetical protein
MQQACTYRLGWDKRLPPLTAGGTKRFCPIEVLHVLSKIALKFGSLPKQVSVLTQNSLRAYTVSSFVSNTRMKVLGCSSIVEVHALAGR